MRLDGRSPPALLKELILKGVQSVIILQVGSRGWFSEKRSIKARLTEGSIDVLVVTTNL
jgi:hypothetical protein